MAKKKFFDIDNNESNDNDIYNFSKGIDNSVNSDLNNNNNSEYSDHIHVEESKAKEQLYDRNNPLVKSILIVLGLVAIVGTIYYIYVFISTK